MENLKVSVCITVKNEEKTIGRLLESLLLQSKKPNEIIIVDGGSTDKTIQIINHFQKKSRKIKLLKEKLSISKGRNLSIEVAKFPIIAHTDAGCVAKIDWLEKLTYPFKHKNVGMVAGFYEMLFSNPLQEAMNVFHGTPPERFDSNEFLPSTRSVAFRKTLWEKIGGYSEKLEKTGEDTLFFFHAVKRNVRIVRVEEAQVIWEETKLFTLKDSMKKFFIYAKGDAQAGIWWHPTKQLASHNIKISAIYLRYLLGLLLLINSFNNILYLKILITGFIFYLFWSIWKWKDVITKWKARKYLPIIQILSDFAVMGGFLSGLIQKK